MKNNMLRVAVIGTSGAGKTTFARRLAQITGGLHIELDAIHWQPNWVELPQEELRERVSRAATQERWVIDGNYSKVRDLIWRRATHIVWLNYPFLTVFTRVLYRTVRRLIIREVLFAGNRESFRSTFLSRDSILRWMLTTYGRNRRQYRALFDQREIFRI